MSSMLDASPRTRGVGSWLGLAGTAAAHALVLIAASYAGVAGAEELKMLMPVTEMIEVALPEPPPPPAATPDPAPSPPPVRSKVPAPAPASPPVSDPPDPPPVSDPPPASAGAAGEVLEAKSDVVDFGDTVVTGQRGTYAGGVTDGSGNSRLAAHDRAARGDFGGSGLKPTAAPAVDLSRAPQLAGGSRWDCPFPLEADDAGIDHAVVTLRVSIGADGRVQSVVTSRDPGNGFGREARRCASAKRWAWGLDREGRPTSAVTVVNVRFDR